MSKILHASARQVLDSRGSPTLEVEVISERGFGRAIVPCGASTGSHEAIELRDGDKKLYHGKGVLKAVANVNSKIGPKLSGLDDTNQRLIDETLIKLDGTQNKGKLGANAIVGASMAAARAGACSSGLPLYKYISKISHAQDFVMPMPFCNVINGGMHAGNNLDIQEHMIVPTEAKSFGDAIRMCSEVYHQLKKVLLGKYGKQSTNVGDEGGFAPTMNDPNEPFDAITDAIVEMGYQGEVKIAVDCAATNFYKDKTYTVGGTTYNGDQLINFYNELCSRYSIVSIEDPFAEEDWENFSRFTKEMKGKVQIVGDDLFVSNVNRLKKGFEKAACDALLLKVNQVGTVSEAMEAANLAKKHKYTVMVSHRSGESEDTFIADFAIGLGCGQLKSGAPARSDRTAKYNQLLRIEEELGTKAKYPHFFKN